MGLYSKDMKIGDHKDLPVNISSVCAVLSHSVVSDSLRPQRLQPSVHGILQARTLEWVAVPFSRGPSPPRGRTWVSCSACRFFTMESLEKPSVKEARCKRLHGVGFQLYEMSRISKCMETESGLVVARAGGANGINCKWTQGIL